MGPGWGLLFSKDGEVMNTQLRILVAVLLAGIVGTMVNAFAASIIIGPTNLIFYMSLIAI